MKFNGAKQRIFDAISCRIPLAKLTTALLRADLLKAMRIHAFHRRKAQHIHRSIQHMNADVDQRATTLQFFIGKDAPARNAAATQGAGGGNVNLSQNAVGHLVTQLLRIERKTMVKVVGQHLAQFARGIAHFPRLFWRHGGRFFAHHMAARFQCHQGMFVMKTVR